MDEAEEIPSNDFGRLGCRPDMDRLTTTIERSWLAEIIAGTKRTEYRELKAYWTRRLSRVGRPFELRLINGMQKNAPEVTVLITRVTRNPRERYYALHIGRVLGWKHWDRRRQRPTRRPRSG